MKDTVMECLQLTGQFFIHETIASFILPVPIKDRMKPGGRLWKENAGFLYIAGISGSQSDQPEHEGHQPSGCAG